MSTVKSEIFARASKELESTVLNDLNQEEKDLKELLNENTERDDRSGGNGPDSENSKETR